MRTAPFNNSSGVRWTRTIAPGLRAEPTNATLYRLSYHAMNKNELESELKRSIEFHRDKALQFVSGEARNQVFFRFNETLKDVCRLLGNLLDSRRS